MELDFLRTRPATPAVSWLLLAAGVAMAVLAGNRYLVLGDDLARAKAHAAGRPGQARVPAVPAPAAPGPDAGLLALSWGELFARLEAGRPAGIAFLSLEADGRKGSLNLTAEARNEKAMLDYLAALRQPGGFRGVTLSGHSAMVAAGGGESLRFVVRMDWQP
jgi:hypothetical protein